MQILRDLHQNVTDMKATIYSQGTGYIVSIHQGYVIDLMASSVINTTAESISCSQKQPPVIDYRGHWWTMCVKLTSVHVCNKSRYAPRCWAQNRVHRGGWAHRGGWPTRHLEYCSLSYWGWWAEISYTIYQRSWYICCKVTDRWCRMWHATRQSPANSLPLEVTFDTGKDLTPTWKPAFREFTCVEEESQQTQ